MQNTQSSDHPKPWQGVMVRAATKFHFKFHFNVVLWGQFHTQLFSDVVLPNHLASQNLEALKENKENVKYFIYTSSIDKKALEASNSYKLLCKTLQTEVVVIDSILENTKDNYKIFNQAHYLGIEKANKEDAAFVFLTPDLIWNDGAFKQLFHHAKLGKHVILVAGFSVTQDTALGDYYKLIEHQPQGTYQALHSRKLVQLMLQHMHSREKKRFWSAPDFTQCPAQIYFPVDDNGFICRSFHLHPLMVYPDRKNIFPQKTIDVDWISKVCSDFKNIYIAQDSDEFFAIDFCVQPKEVFYYLPKLLKIVVWSKNSIYPDHKYYFIHNIRIHTDNLVSKKWKKVEKKIKPICYMINIMLSHLWIIPLHLAITQYYTLALQYYTLTLRLFGIEETQKLETLFRHQKIKWYIAQYIVMWTLLLEDFFYYGLTIQCHFGVKGTIKKICRFVQKKVLLFAHQQKINTYLINTVLFNTKQKNILLNKENAAS